MPTSNEIREQFLEFFRGKGHEIVPSSPVIPHGDDTLLFTNAGMNQFKDVFLGTGRRDYKRAADTQKCIRAGGKHNDLDDVGKDTYHHTFFEMLGNWSFGDYFKAEAIEWAWELLTKVWGLDKRRLHVTVFGGDASELLEPDHEAAALWKKIAGVDPEHIHMGSKKDNFWEMGATGPCGPCTEIHIDRTPDISGGKLVNAGDARVMEIWNLVFIQFNRGADGKLVPLPAKHVDTGMGFERICSVLEGRDSNYDTTVFAPIIAAIESVASRKYGGGLTDPADIAFRVIADHLRMSTFAIVDGARPGNKRREAVLRSVIRRAFRYGYKELGLKEPFLHKLVPALVDHMGGAFPELKRYPDTAKEVLRVEEEDFLKVIDRGLKLFDEAADRAKKNDGVFSGDDLFFLHGTHGFPADMSAQIARDQGLKPDMDRFRELMEADKPATTTAAAIEAITLEGVETVPATIFVGYETTHLNDARIVAIWNPKGKKVEKGISYDITGDAPFDVAVALDRTPFYVEAGGQVGDVGDIFNSNGRLTVTKVVKAQGAKGPVYIHYGKVTDKTVQVGQTYIAAVTGPRLDTMRNHTATHLLNWALRSVLPEGDKVHQRSSLVDGAKTRFGFSYDRPLTAEEIQRVERRVNEKIIADVPVTAKVLPLNTGLKIPGLRAVFGEKYPDPVRVVMVGATSPEEVTADNSVEFCGGTHVSRTGQIALFKIVAEEGESKGVRRITAVTGTEAFLHYHQADRVASDLAAKLNCRVEDLPARVEALQGKIGELDKALKKGAAADLNSLTDQLLDAAETIGGVKVVVGEIPKVADEAVRGAVDRLKKKAGEAAVVLGAREDGKAVLYSAATAAAVAKGVHAGKVLGEAVALIGGKGGGKPEGIAQGGGSDADKLPDALAKAREMLKAALG